MKPADLIRASEAARALSEALLDLLDAADGPSHPVTVNPATDPEPPEGTVLAWEDAVVTRGGKRWRECGHGIGLCWEDFRRSDWTVLRWGWDAPAACEDRFSRPHGTDRGTTTPEGEIGSQDGTQGVTLATGDIVHLTEMGGRSIEVTLSWDTIQVDTREWCGRHVRIVAEDGDDR